jgi:hypothetical protein
MPGGAPAGGRGRAGPGRYGDAVWQPADPDEPASELYRLLPPQRTSAELEHAAVGARGGGESFRSQDFRGL